MRALTFKGFLTQYVKELSQSNTLNMNLLVRETETNYRLRAPLVLYAVASEKASHLSRLLPISDNTGEMRRMLAKLSADNMEQLLQTEQVPEEYRKVWTAFNVVKGAPGRDRMLKDAMRSKVLQLQNACHCSNYRIYTDLKLNPGNVNCWLKYGDRCKVSYPTAERIVNYVLSAAKG